MDSIEFVGPGPGFLAGHESGARRVAAIRKFLGMTERFPNLFVLTVIQTP